MKIAIKKSKRYFKIVFLIIGYLIFTAGWPGFATKLTSLIGFGKSGVTTYAYGDLEVDGSLQVDNDITATNDITGDSVIATTGLRAGRIVLSNIYHAYGGFQDSSATVAITANDWAVVTNAYNSLWGGSEADGITLSNDTMTVTNAGDYFGICTVSIDGSNGNEYQFRIYDVTGTAQVGYEAGVTGEGDGDTVTMTIVFYFEAVANNEYVMQITNTDGNNSADIISGEFWIIYLHN